MADRSKRGCSADDCHSWARCGRLGGMFDPWLLFAVLVLEACVGYPDSVYRAIRHPVVWLGLAIDALERRWNRPELSDTTRRLLGVVTVLLIAGGAAAIGYVLQLAAANVP